MREEIRVGGGDDWRKDGVPDSGLSVPVEGVMVRSRH